MMLNNDLMECDKPSSYHELDEVLISESNLVGYSDFYKNNEESKIWWIDNIDLKRGAIVQF